MGEEGLGGALIRLFGVLRRVETAVELRRKNAKKDLLLCGADGAKGRVGGGMQVVGGGGGESRRDAQSAISHVRMCGNVYKSSAKWPSSGADTTTRGVAEGGTGGGGVLSVSRKVGQRNASRVFLVVVGDATMPMKDCPSRSRRRRRRR